MRLNWQTSVLYTYSSLVYSLLPRDNLYKNITGEWECLAEVERPLTFTIL